MIVELGPNWQETPPWWKNFVNRIIVEHGVPDEPRYITLDNILKSQYNAALLIESIGEYHSPYAIEFSDSKHMTLFLLKWS